MTIKVQSFFVLALLLCLPAMANETIYWQTYHRPPGVMKSGEHAGKGFVQLMLNQIIRHMPEYKHEMPITTLARALADMKSGKNVCHPSLFITEEREQYVWFSQPAIFNPTNRIIIRKALAKKLDLTTVDLQLLLTDPELTFAFVKGRAFGGKIDHILNNADLGERAFWISSENLSTMFQLIQLGRIDVTIAYPFEVEYFSLQNSKNLQKLAVLPIQDEAMYIEGSIGCAKTSWGRKVISRVDEILQEIKPSKEYRDALTTWWREESQTEQFKNRYNLYFLQ